MGHDPHGACAPAGRDVAPGERARLQDDRTLVPDAVEELLRLTSPVQGLARTTTRDARVGNAVIPAGRKVLLGYAMYARMVGYRYLALDYEDPAVTIDPHIVAMFSSPYRRVALFTSFDGSARCGAPRAWT